MPSITVIELSNLITYAIAFSIAVAIPGPGVTALVARSLNSGALAGFALLLGIIFGDITYLSIAVFGLAVIAQHFAAVFELIKWVAMLYLCYLAWQFWTAEHTDLSLNTKASKRDLLSATVSGYVITMANPKAIAFYLALLPVLMDISQITVRTWGLVLVPITAGLLLLICSVFILGAVWVRKTLSSQHAQKMLYRSAALAMLMAAGSMMWNAIEASVVA